jgi:hypothetical protein
MRIGLIGHVAHMWEKESHTKVWLESLKHIDELEDTYGRIILECIFGN